MADAVEEKTEANSDPARVIAAVWASGPLGAVGESLAADIMRALDAAGYAVVCRSTPE